MITFEQLVDDIHAAHLAFGKTEVSKEDVGDIVRATVKGLGLCVHSSTGEVYDPAPKPVMNYPEQNGVHYRGQRRRGGRR